MRPDRTSRKDCWTSWNRSVSTKELEDPGANTVILMEWGEQMASTLAPERLEVHIDRPLDDGQDDKTAERQPTSDGTRVVTLVPVGPAWDGARISRFTTPTA